MIEPSGKPVYYDGSGKNHVDLKKSNETVVKADSAKSSILFPYFPYQR